MAAPCLTRVSCGGCTLGLPGWAASLPAAPAQGADPTPQEHPHSRGCLALGSAPGGAGCPPGALGTLFGEQEPHTQKHQLTMRVDVGGRRSRGRREGTGTQGSRGGLRGGSPQSPTEEGGAHPSQPAPAPAPRGRLQRADSSRGREHQEPPRAPRPLSAGQTEVPAQRSFPSGALGQRWSAPDPKLQLPAPSPFRTCR